MALFHLMKHILALSLFTSQKDVSIFCFFICLELADLIQVTRPFLQQISKAKAGRLVRTLVDLFLDIEAGTGREIDLVKECIEWAGNERRTFLKQALEAKLMGLYADNEHYEDALLLGRFDPYQVELLIILSNSHLNDVFQEALCSVSLKNWMTRSSLLKFNSWKARCTTV